MNGGNKWTELNQRIPLISTICLIRSLLISLEDEWEWFNEYWWNNNSIRYSPYCQIKQTFAQQFKIMKFRMSNKHTKLGHLHNPGPGTIPANRVQRRHLWKTHELITLTSPAIVYINKLWETSVSRKSYFNLGIQDNKMPQLECNVHLIYPCLISTHIQGYR